MCDLGDAGSSVVSMGTDLAANTLTLGGYGAYKGADAQGKYAQAQEGQERADREAALKYAEATPEELANLNRMIQVNEADIARKEKLLASVDPAIIEAGRQALALLKGEKAASLDPLSKEFDAGESKLREKLMAQLGAGYETSTAGIQALSAFNQKKDMTLADAQSKTLGQLLGVSQNVSAQGYSQNVAAGATLGQMLGNIQGRKINAITGNPIDSAGSQFVGDMARARAGTGIFDNALKFAGMAAGIPPTGTSGGSSGGGVGQGGMPY